MNAVVAAEFGKKALIATGKLTMIALENPTIQRELKKGAKHLYNHFFIRIS